VDGSELARTFFTLQVGRRRGFWKTPGQSGVSAAGG